MEKYKQIKKQLGITDADVAAMFGYKDANSLRNSSRKNQVIQGVIALYDLINSTNENSNDL